MGRTESTTWGRFFIAAEKQSVLWGEGSGRGGERELQTMSGSRSETNAERGSKHQQLSIKTHDATTGTTTGVNGSSLVHT